jgi:hypothetical protein
VMTMHTKDLPVAVIGAGPVGLAAAAHLLERGLEPLVLEASEEVGASVRDWGHVRLFSPWRFNVDKAALRLLERGGWQAPPADDLPTGGELYARYLRPLAELPALRERLRLGRRVVALARRGIDKVRTSGRQDKPFLIRTTDRDGRSEQFEARAVIDASGTWATPNPLGATGLPALGEEAHAQRIHYGIPDVLGRDRERYLGRTTLVVGAGHSAANSILALAELARLDARTTIHWAVRGENLSRVFGGGAGDALPARGQLGTDLRRMVEQGRLSLWRGVHLEEVRARGEKLEVTGTRAGEPFVYEGIDSIIAATGQRPDLQPLREMRLSLDGALECVSALGPLIDPNEHSCGTVRPHGARELAQPEPGLYVVGSKSYGRAPTFLLATGYEQARSVVAMLAGDVVAAERVELELPETGVCSSPVAEAQSSCCGPAPQTKSKSSCC